MSVDALCMYDHLNESYRAVLYCGVVICTVQGSSNFSVVLYLCFSVF